MKCPVCRIEMEHGYVQASQFASWVKKPNKIMYAPKNDYVEFITPAILCINAVPADICKSCKKIVVDYSKI